MPWLRFWKRDDEEPASPPSSGSAERPLPPHLAAARARTQAGDEPDRVARRAAELNRRRQAALFDIEQGELATTPDNPWQERVALLGDALVTVNEDVSRLDNAPPEPFAPVPATPIGDIQVSDDDPPSVSFIVGDEQFRYAEEIDWAERGHQVARGELRRQEGDPLRLVPPDTPESPRDALGAHLTDSLFVFASDLRDRVIDGESLPDRPELADLARPCHTCGGWLDWRGRCQACARRNAERQRLKRESDRLLDERASEAEEQHRFVERLPVARRRLADVEIELNALERTAARD